MTETDMNFSHSTFIIFNIFFLFILLPSCTKETSIFKAEPRQFSQADPRLWTVLTEFEQQAHLRGVFFDIEAADLIAVIDTINSPRSTVGLCAHDSTNPNQIIIDANYWKRASKMRRELIVFHELGHCLLGLDHDNSHDDTGACMSIMRSGEGTCLDVYNAQNRVDFLDELFEQY